MVEASNKDLFGYGMWMRIWDMDNTNATELNSTDNNKYVENSKWFVGELGEVLGEPGNPRQGLEGVTLVIGSNRR